MTNIKGIEHIITLIPREYKGVVVHITNHVERIDLFDCVSSIYAIIWHFIKRNEIVCLVIHIWMNWKYPMFNPLSVNLGCHFEVTEVFFKYSGDFWYILVCHFPKLGVSTNFKILLSQPICLVEASLDEPLDIEETMPIGTLCYRTGYLCHSCVYCLPHTFCISDSFDFADEHWCKTPVPIVGMNTKKIDLNHIENILTHSHFCWNTWNVSNEFTRIIVADTFIFVSTHLSCPFEGFKGVCQSKSFITDIMSIQKFMCFFKFGFIPWKTIGKFDWFIYNILLLFNFLATFIYSTFLRHRLFIPKCPHLQYK